jgi:hypothetical protein
MLAAAMACAGCGRSSEPIDGELSKAARDSVFQKKVDVTNRALAQPQSRNAARSSKDRRP